MVLYFWANFPVSATGARSLRLRLPLLWASRCRLLAWCRLSLPEAVTRKRFLDPLWVFILGMTAPPRPAGRDVPRGDKKEKDPWSGPRVPGGRVPAAAV